MESVYVATKDELKQASSSGAIEIVVEGELADKLRTTKKIATLGKYALGLVTAAAAGSIALTPVTGGASLVGLAPVAAFTGIEVAAIIVAASLGIGLILAVFKGYEEISYSKGHLVLRKKQAN